MAKLLCDIIDARYSGFAFEPKPPVVAPIRARYKWRPWKKSLALWGVVQPKRKVIGSSVDWVWEPVAVFFEKEDADNFLEQMTP